MRLLVKRGHSLINDLRFEKGPVYVGRQPQCQVFLPDRSVSRQHAVILLKDAGTWMVKDLESANRTYVNQRPVQSVPLREGDVIGISDFRIEVHFVDQPVGSKVSKERPLEVDVGADTVVAGQKAVQSIYSRKAGAGANHMMHLPTQRIDDFYKLSIALARKDEQEDLLKELNAILLLQFAAYHAWTGLRETTDGPLTCYGGCSRGGATVTLDQLPGKPLIQEALQEQCYLLLPHIDDIIPSSQTRGEVAHLCSAMAAPIMSPVGAYGIIYVDNGADQAPFSHQDFDYLILIATHVAALLEHIG